MIGLGLLTVVALFQSGTAQAQGNDPAMQELLGGIDQCAGFVRNPAGAKTRFLSQGWLDESNAPGIPDTLKNKEEAGLIRKGRISLLFSSAEAGKANGATDPANLCTATTRLPGTLDEHAAVIRNRYGLTKGKTASGTIAMASSEIDVLVEHPERYRGGVRVIVSSLGKAK